MHVFEAVVADDGEVQRVELQAEMALGAAGRNLAEVVLPMDGVARCRRPPALGIGPQRHAVEVARRGEPGKVEDRRHDVDRLGEVLDDGPRATAPGPRRIRGTWQDASKKPNFPSVQWSPIISPWSEVRTISVSS